MCLTGWPLGCKVPREGQPASPLPVLFESATPPTTDLWESADGAQAQPGWPESGDPVVQAPNWALEVTLGKLALGNLRPLPGKRRVDDSQSTCSGFSRMHTTVRRTVYLTVYRVLIEQCCLITHYHLPSLMLYRMANRRTHGAGTAALQTLRTLAARA